MKINSPEWAYLLFGCIGCIINGGLVPIYAYFYGQVFEVNMSQTLAEVYIYGLISINLLLFKISL